MHTLVFMSPQFLSVLCQVRQKCSNIKGNFKKKAMHEIIRGLILEYVAEFMFKLVFPKNTFGHFWQCVSIQYPLNPESEGYQMTRNDD